MTRETKFLEVVGGRSLRLLVVGKFIEEGE